MHFIIILYIYHVIFVKQGVVPSTINIALLARWRNSPVLYFELVVYVIQQ